MLKVLSSILCDLDPKVKVIGQKAGICDGLPSTSALVLYNYCVTFNCPLSLYLPLSSADTICKQFGLRSGPTKVRPDLSPNCLTL